MSVPKKTKKNTAINAKLNPADNWLNEIKRACAPPPKNKIKSNDVKIIEKAIGKPKSIKVRNTKNIKIPINFTYPPFR